MQRIEIDVNKRDPRANAKSLRRNGRLPGICYGAGGESVEIELDAHEFVKLGLGSSGAHIMRFKSEDAALSGSIALVKDLQVHPITDAPMHVDLLRIDVNKPVDAEVALSFTGKCKGVVSGGILQPLRRELEVRALPDRLPEVIEIDVTELDVHDAIHIEDLTLPEGVEAIFSENFTLVTVVPPTVEEEPEVAEDEELVAEGGEEAPKDEEDSEKAEEGGE